MNIKTNNLKFKGALLCIFTLLFIFSTPGLNAQLCMPASDYDELSWTWSYAGPCTNSYNCLGYAIGTMVWEWPWDASCATDRQVRTFLATKGFYSYGYNAKIVTYGSSTDCIKHFAKVTGSSTVRAKCGGANLLDHGSWDPYYPDSDYGEKQDVYNGTRYPQVTISGPTSMPYSGTYQWCANVFYGTPPYSYKWEYEYPFQLNPFLSIPRSLGTSSCAVKSGIFDQNTYLKVEVTDAAGKKTSTWIFIMVGSSGSSGGGLIRSSSFGLDGLESLSDKTLIEANLFDLLNEATSKNITSPNPYDYINSEHFRRIVQMGPAALMTIRKMILTSEENGLGEYILAIAAEEIARVNLKGNSFAWTHGKGFCRKWDHHIGRAAGFHFENYRFKRFN